MKGRIGIVAALLVVTYLVVRLPNLGAQPVFCDEATYVRWGQLIHEDPVANAFVSMKDAKLPLHYWLLALAQPRGADPVYAGRVLSVIFGALTIPVLLLLCGELGRAQGARASVDLHGKAPDFHPGFRWGVFACVLMIFCPLVAMNQRMALAEPLLLLEAVTIGWLSLRLARRIAEGVARRALAMDAVVLGGIWGATLLTKQNFSYVLWILPPAAIALRLWGGGWAGGGTILRVFMARYAVATLIGLACFIPVLFTASPYNLRTRLFYKPMFTVSSVNVPRWEMALQNARALVVPRAEGAVRWWPYEVAAPLESGLLYLYLTPPILLLAGVGLYGMVRRRIVRGQAAGPLIFLGVWIVALLGALLPGANILYSRYLLLGAFPLVILAAWSLAEGCRALRMQGAAVGNGRGRAVVAGLILAGAIGWPAWATVRAVGNGDAPTLSRGDREQYLMGSSAGYAAQQAIDWLDEEARRNPITLVTGAGLGVQNDLTWIRLSHHPQIQLYCDDSTPPLRPAPPPARSNQYLAGLEQWSRTEREVVSLPAGRAIYVEAGVVRDVRTGEWDTVPMQTFLGPGTRLVSIFTNPPLAAGMPARDAVVIFRITPAGWLQASAEGAGSDHVEASGSLK